MPRATPLSAKHYDFVEAPIDQKPVNQVPGVGRAMSGALARIGITSASQLLGQFMLMNQDKEQFNGWLMSLSCRSNCRTRNDIYAGLLGWHQQHC